MEDMTITKLLSAPKVDERGLTTVLVEYLGKPLNMTLADYSAKAVVDHFKHTNTPYIFGYEGA
jgi:hypothetical protein